jgi:PPK2 family polyphosphate:nucleotide phosphotransferase
MEINLKQLAKQYRVTAGKKFHLNNFDPDDTWKLKSKESAQELLSNMVERIDDLQKQLYAQREWAVLAIFQGIDASGKDGAITHVLSGLNPLGCQAYSFKAPAGEEVFHDYLWRCQKRLPERGCIGIFNRSYYEEVLIVKVHPHLLPMEKLPARLVDKDLWRQRYEDMVAFERYLGRNGIVVRKFFFNLSRREQKKRFLSRLEEPDKNWKFSLEDVRERQFWPEYRKAYEAMVQNTASEHAPWHIIPADHKWFTRLAVAAVILETLESLNLNFPKVNAARRKELRVARAALVRER